MIESNHIHFVDEASPGKLGTRKCSDLNLGLWARLPVTFRV
jgi:hypothetical protein